MSYNEYLKRLGIEPISNCFQEFSIADRYSAVEIIDTYERFFKEAQSDYRLLTELVVVLTQKVIQHSEIPHQQRVAELYGNLLDKTEKYALNNLQGEELEYYHKIAD